ncbi:hypothetical protein FIBSPDRAFT_886200 [Athelia psychrophila]|uniref:Uncharacterized protein n=1 Tax=Athelia psychrophila TaxID=1759441 RepID=A0A166R762_9AGAM|nr:hypothetical protein FIBSPDRAFT_886200 [Fibularhizoctonia sp. CBS 109695]
MSQIIDMFKVKLYDLDTLYTGWTDGPMFYGDSKKDLPVQAWMDQIKADCIERKVPEQCWHKVAQHFMGPMATSRFDEVKKVMAQVQGSKYKWDWKKFRVAMTSMSWKTDSRKMEPLKIEKKSGGSWFVSRAKKEKEVQPDVRSDGWEWIKSKDVKEEPVQQKETTPSKPTRRKSVSNLLVRRSTMKEDVPPPPPLPLPATRLRSNTNPRPTPVRSNTSLRPTPVRSNTMKRLPQVPIRTDTLDSGVEITSPALQVPDITSLQHITKITEVPAWLLEACGALDLLTTEHPKIMSTLAAVLITVGSIPALPFIAGGAGGAILASGAVHAAGAVAVGLGTMIKAQQSSKQRTMIHQSADVSVESGSSK